MYTYSERLLALSMLHSMKASQLPSSRVGMRSKAFVKQFSRAAKTSGNVDKEQTRPTMQLFFVIT